MAFCGACGATHDDVVEICPETREPVRDAGPCGARIDRYDVDRLLGIGGFGAVYLARHSMLRQQVALKLMRKQRLTDPKTAERFLREARAAAAVSHPHIVQMFDCGIVDGQPFLVMELLAGRDLADVLAARKKLSIGEALDIATQSLDALHAAHARGIVHRDMKPSNVLLLDRDPDGAALTRPYVKLLDFGISKVLHEETLATQGNAVLGTPAYMAPEQVLTPQSIDHRADLYALAVMLYEMLAGRLPFEADSVGELLRRALTDKPPPLRAIAPEIPEHVAAVVERGLARDRDARWANARALKDALQRAMQGQAPLFEPSQQRPTAEVAYDDPSAPRRVSQHETRRARSERPIVGQHGTVASVPPRSERPPARPELELRETRAPEERARTSSRPRGASTSGGGTRADATQRSSPWILPVIALALLAMIGVSGAAAVIAWAWQRSTEGPIASLEPGAIGSTRAPSAPPVSMVTLHLPSRPGGTTTIGTTTPASTTPATTPPTTPTPPPTTPIVMPSTEPAAPPRTPTPPWPADDPEPQPPAPMPEWEGQNIGLRSDEVNGVRFEVIRITGANPASPVDVVRGLERLRAHFERCRPERRSQLVRLRVMTQFDGRGSVAGADERNPGSADATRCAIGAVNSGPVFPRVNEIITFDVLLRRR